MYPWGVAHSEQRIAELRKMFAAGGPLWPVGGGVVIQPLSVTALEAWEAGDAELAIRCLRAEPALWAVFRGLTRGARGPADMRQAFALLVTFEKARNADRGIQLERVRAAAAKAGEYPEARVGDWLCPGVDIDKWKAANRVVMYPGKWQIWKLYRTDRDNPSPEDIEQTARAVVLQWFKTIEAGDVDHIETLSGPPAASKRIKRRLDLPGVLPTVHAKTPIPVWVSFVYRGSSTDGPWPVHKAQVLNPWCPVDADWILDEVWLPDEAKPIPKAPSVPELIRPEVEKAKEWLGDWGTGFGTWLAVVALVGVTVAAATFGRAAGR